MSGYSVGKQANQQTRRDWIWTINDITIFNTVDGATFYWNGCSTIVDITFANECLANRVKS